jgi:hypothetical protein
VLRLLTVPSYKPSARMPRKTPSFSVDNACLLVRCLAMDVVLLGALPCGNVFTDLLPSNGMHIVTYKGDLSLNVDNKNRKWIVSNSSFLYWSRVRLGYTSLSLEPRSCAVLCAGLATPLVTQRILMASWNPSVFGFPLTSVPRVIHNFVDCHS